MSYIDYLISLIDNKNNEFNDEFKVNLYLTLLFLSNKKYTDKVYKNEIDTIEDYLRKVNNYKVKIQLKRKESEIDKLLNDIKEIYENNKNIIDKYNRDKLDIISILDNKDAKEITKLIDKLTKVKMKKINTINTHNELLNTSINKYQIDNNNITINDSIKVGLDEFYDIYDYLTNISNYQEIYSKEEVINSHKDIITSIINIINNNDNINNNILIPVILTYLNINNISNYEDITTNKFHIENIKISDLYKLANNNIDNINKVKWRNIIIPNDYLYNKIKEITFKGMYYYKDDNFILDTKSDFKISIKIDDMISFIKDNLNLLVDKEHI